MFEYYGYTNAKKGPWWVGIQLDIFPIPKQPMTSNEKLKNYSNSSGHFFFVVFFSRLLRRHLDDTLISYK